MQSRQPVLGHWKWSVKVLFLASRGGQWHSQSWSSENSYGPGPWGVASDPSMRLLYGKFSQMDTVGVGS